jgi:hypothetical protein
VLPTASGAAQTLFGRRIPTISVTGCPTYFLPNNTLGRIPAALLAATAALANHLPNRPADHLAHAASSVHITTTLRTLADHRRRRLPLGLALFLRLAHLHCNKTLLSFRRLRSFFLSFLLCYMFYFIEYMC